MPCSYECLYSAYGDLCHLITSGSCLCVCLVVLTNLSDCILCCWLGAGLYEPTLKGEYEKWNGMTSIDDWGTPMARMINGTDGTLFGTGLMKNDTIYIFSDQAQR